MVMTTHSGQKPDSEATPRNPALERVAQRVKEIFLSCGDSDWTPHLTEKHGVEGPCTIGSTVLVVLSELDQSTFLQLVQHDVLGRSHLLSPAQHLLKLISGIQAALSQAVIDADAEETLTHLLASLHGASYPEALRVRSDLLLDLYLDELLMPITMWIIAQDPNLASLNAQRMEHAENATPPPPRPPVDD